jgi:hypothetical protein
MINNGSTTPWSPIRSSSEESSGEEVRSSRGERTAQAGFYGSAQTRSRRDHYHWCSSAIAPTHQIRLQGALLGPSGQVGRTDYFMSREIGIVAARERPANPPPPAPPSSLRKYYPSLNGRDVFAVPEPLLAAPESLIPRSPDAMVNRSVYPDGRVSTRIRVITTLPDGKPAWAPADQIPEGATVLETTRHAF